MTVYLCIPHPPHAAPTGTIPSNGVARLKLRWTTQDPRSCHGQGVLIDAAGDVIDGHMMDHLVRVAGAWLELAHTDRTGQVMSALGGGESTRAWIRPPPSIKII